MSAASVVPMTEDINAIRENYDTSNPVIAEILKAKEERLKLLQELNKEYEEDFDGSELLLKNDFKKEKKKPPVKSERNSSFTPGTLRRSTRLLNSPIVKKNISYLEPVRHIRPPNDYGAIPGVEVGTHWETRMECSLYGVHRPTVAGIHGGPDGAYSIALSGGYPEDVDDGHSFLYTGAGGRDLRGTSVKPKNLRTAPQTMDQKLEGTNLSLVRSIETEKPVRVIRGYKSPSFFAPESGYRYDGLYQVVKYWEDVGKTGYKIFRFKMVRMKNQAPPPWETNTIIYAPRTTDMDENMENELSDTGADESEFKENIAPTDCIPEIPTSPNRNINNKEVKDVDNEIQMCIDFFCKATVIKYSQDSEKDSNKEEFHGWD